MFSVLRAPTPLRTRRRAGIAVSAVVHCLFIAALVHASGVTDPVVSTRPIEAALVFVPLSAPRHPHVAGPDPRVSATPRLPRLDIEAPIVAITPVASVDVLVSASQHLSVPGGLFPLAGDASDASDAGHQSPSQSGPVGASPESGPVDATEVDEAAALVPGTAAPPYPPSLQASGIEGVVRMEFVVDTLGHARRESLRALSSDDPAFAAAARDAIVRARYTPARWHGRIVAQLVEPVFAFHIER